MSETIHLPGGRRVTGLDWFNARWIDPPQLTEWLERNMPGRTLNLCSGVSGLADGFGDVKLDSEPVLQPDVVGDVFDLDFEDRAFDSVYVDPPYRFYDPGRMGRWEREVWRVAGQRAVFQTKHPTQLNLGNEAHGWVAGAVVKPGTEGWTGWLLQVYDRVENRKDDFRFDGPDGATVKRKAKTAAIGLLVRQGAVATADVREAAGLGEESHRTVRMALKELVEDGLAVKEAPGGHTWYPGPLLQGSADRRTKRGAADGGPDAA